MGISNHVGYNAKAYMGAAASVVSQPIADHGANILMWLISLNGVIMPDSVQVSARYILVAAITGFAVRYVSNAEKR